MFPSAVVNTLDNKPVDIATMLSKDGRPIVMVFFDMSCKPCLAELNKIAETYEDWQQETGVTLVAIALDDERMAPHVKPYVEGKVWSYQVYLDTDHKLKSALGITIRPTTLILDGARNIVWRRSSFEPEDESAMLEKVREIR